MIKKEQELYLGIASNGGSTGGGEGGTTNHRQLSNRNAYNSHPISAITGLEEALNNAGSIQDIKVNGESVVVDKVANIEIADQDLSNYQTKLSEEQLQNISDVPNKANSIDVYSKDEADTTFIKATEKGQANGVATLNNMGVIPNEQVNISSLNVKGTWNASTNTPALVNGVGTSGDFYITSVAGSVDFGAGEIDFAVGDWALYTDSGVWEKSVNASAVQSVNGKTGLVNVLDTDVLNEEQLKAVNSGIDEVKVAQIETNKTDIAETKTNLEELSMQVATNTGTIEAKLDKTTDVANAGKVLTVGDDGAIGFSEVSGKAYTILEELGLDASATLNNAVNAIPAGSSALFNVKLFTNWTEYFPNEESNDGYSRVYIVKGDDLSKVFCQWFRKDGAKSAIAKMDSNNQVVGWERITLNPYNSNVYKTYGGIGELNTAKGTSITLVANEDNTQKILDALGPREEFIEWFGNSNNRFGINPATFGTRINCIRITKMNATNGYVFAMMNTGAVLNRVYADSVLGEWFSVGHKLDDGFTDDGTICLAGQNVDSSGMYGNGVAPETLGMTRDIMTWENGCYKLSHFTDLENAPEGVGSGRLEHFNLKRWQGNHNPHTKDWAERMSIFYSRDGNIYTRYQESGATAGVLEVDTGWRKITQNEIGLISNSATFTIDITKRNVSWYCPFKFTYMYGISYCEIDFVLTTELSYTTKGPTYIDSITYTIDGANVKIGIKFTTAMYGTQVVSFPSECGTINALTKDEFTGASEANYKGSHSIKSYSSFAELRIEQTATLQDILNAMVDNSMFVFHPGALPSASKAEYLNLTYATVTIFRRLANRIQILMTDKDTGDLYIGKFNSTNTFAGWNKVVTEDATPTVTTVTLPSAVTSGSVKYCVKNGVCYVSINSLKGSSATSINITMPKALMAVSQQVGGLGSGSIKSAVFMSEGNTAMIIGLTTTELSANFSYPVA